MAENNSKLIEKLKSIPEPNQSKEPKQSKKRYRPTRIEYLQRLKEKVAKLEAELQGKEYKEPDEIEPQEDLERIKEITEPNPLLIPIIKIPFDVWADINKVDDLRLSDREAKDIALYTTQLIDYYLPKVPSIAYAWLGLATSLYAVIQPRLKIIKDLKKQKEQSSEIKNEGEKSNLNNGAKG